MLVCNTINKSDWADKNGPWMQEPDEAQWIYAGFDCLIIRGASGAFWGFVAIPWHHQYFNIPHQNIDLHVHGGLTFGDTHVPDMKSICHVRKDERGNKNLYWLGFDCAHGSDICPRYDYRRWEGSTYKDFNFVKQEVENLASQLAVIVSIKIGINNDK